MDKQKKGTKVKRFQVISDYWKLLQPFHHVFKSFVLLLILYEGLQIAEGYVLSVVIRLYGIQAEKFVWLGFFGMLLVYDEIFMRLDNQVDWHVITKHIYPIYKFLKLGAFKKFLDMDSTWHQQHNSGSLVGKVANGVEKVQEIIDGLSWEFVPTFIQTILSFIPIVIFSPLAGLISLFAFIGFVKLSLQANNKRHPFRVQRYNLYEEESHRFVESIQGYATVQRSGQTKRVTNELEQLHEKVMHLGHQEARIGIFTYNRWRIRILTIARRAILAVWIWQLYSHTMDIATIVFVNVLMEKLFSSFWRFARLLDRTSEASEGATRLVDVMQEHATYTHTGTITSTTEPLHIELDHVSFAYPKKGDTLYDVNFTIEEGKITALVGRSGSGKTTISKLIAGEIPVQKGRITLGGIDIKEWRKDVLIGTFSFVPQGDEVTIFNTTIQDNIAFPRPEASLEEVIHAAKLAGIHTTIMKMPNGYATDVGERGQKLSGGQKQRVALARAILADSPVFILDEATSAVDTLTEQEIQYNMKHILHGKTALVVAHRLSTIKAAHKIVVMEEGRVVEEGTHDELIAKGGLYAQMVDSQTLTHA